MFFYAAFITSQVWGIIHAILVDDPNFAGAGMVALFLPIMIIGIFGFLIFGIVNLIMIKKQNVSTILGISIAEFVFGLGFVFFGLLLVIVDIIKFIFLSKIKKI